MIFAFYLMFTIEFSDLNLQPPKQFVKENFIAHIEEHFIAYCSALAGITAIKYLLRF
ncbi:MAG: hypothetical protein QNJ42_18715 [Crocosphaera sp.]|nr:hypothetical protein [Crocosphaera sp.]